MTAPENFPEVDVKVLARELRAMEDRLLADLGLPIPPEDPEVPGG